MLAAPLRRDVGETIQAALLYADLRGFTALTESNPPALVLSALDAWFDRIAGAVHAFGGEVLKFIGDGVSAIFPVVGEGPRAVADEFQHFAPEGVNRRAIRSNQAWTERQQEDCFR